MIVKYYAYSCIYRHRFVQIEKNFTFSGKARKI